MSLVTDKFIKREKTKMLKRVPIAQKNIGCKTIVESSVNMIEMIELLYSQFLRRTYLE